MALVPDSIERYTTNLLLPIYKYAAARWHEALNNIADLVDVAVKADRDRLDVLEVEHNNDGSHGDVKADFISLGGVKRASWGTLVTNGSATAGSVNSLADNGADFGVQALDGMVVSIISGTGNGQVRKILSHTGTVITPTENWTIAPGAASQYEIYATSNQTLNQSVIAEAAQNAIGNILNPLLSLPLRNSLSLERGVGTVNFTRASTATYIDRAGVVKTAAIDEARFEDGMLLHEGVSTNEFTYSEEFDNAIWLKQYCSVVSNNATSPDGAITADKLVEDTTTNTHYMRYFVTGVPDNSSFSFSICLKSAGRNWVYIAVRGKDGSSFGSYFDLSTGSIGSVSNGALPKIFKLSDGYYRCAVSIVDVLTGAFDQVCSVYLAMDDNVINYLGDGVSGVHIYGAQSEKINFVTSYIKSVASPVTRSADYLNISGTETPGVNQSVTVILDCIISGNHALRQELVVYAPMRILLFGGTTAIRVDHDNNVGYVHDNNFDKFTKKTRFGVRWDGVFSSLWYDGLKKLDSINGDALANYTVISIGSNLNSFHLYGHISSFKLYDMALTDTEMQLA